MIRTIWKRNYFKQRTYPSEKRKHGTGRKMGRLVELNYY
jgi:hypothetical protein